MNAAQLQNITHLESIIPRLTRLSHSCVHVFTVLLRGCDSHRRQYTTCGGVLSSTAMAACVRPWLWCRGMDPKQAHAPIMFTSNCPENKKTTAYTASVGFFRPFSLLIWLHLHRMEWPPPPPSRFSVNSLLKTQTSTTSLPSADGSRMRFVRG